MTNYIVVDTESTGLPDHKKPADAVGQPRMAAIGMILIDGNLEIQEERAFLIKPDGWTFDDNSDAAKVNGLTHELLMADGVPARDALRIYGAAIDARRVVVGWNITHDLKMLRGELRSVGFPDRYMQTRHLCCMQGSRKIVDARTEDGRKKAPKLEEACAFFEIERHGAHTGIGDARDTLAILRKLRDLGQVPAYKDPYDKGGPPKTDPTQPRENLYARGQFDLTGEDK